MTGFRDQEEGPQELLGKWKASGKRASSKMILKTMTFKKMFIFSNFWLHEACWTLVPQSGIKPMPPTVEA